MRRYIVFALLLILVPRAAPLQPIGYGQTATGQLTTAQPEVFYIFSAQAGDVLTITMNRLDGVIDPLLVLTDESQNNVLAVDNDSGGDHNARLRFVIPNDGRYVIKATAVQSSDLNGSYQLALLLGNPTPTPSANVSLPRLAALKANDSPHADLNETIRFRLYTLSLKKGDALSAKLDIDSGLQAGLYLYTSDFDELARAELGATLNYTVSAEGPYVLIVGRSAGAGSYTLNITLPDEPAQPLDAPFLIPGQAQPGHIGERIGMAYRFEARPGTSIDLILNGLDAVLIVTDAEMREVGSSTDGQMRGVALPHAGRYLIFVIRPGGPNDTTVGDFSLTLRGTINATLAPTSPGPAINEIAYGRTINDAISATRTLIFYTFQGTAGDVITIQMNHISGNGLDPLLYLYSYSDNTPVPLTSSDNRAPGDINAAILDFTLPRTGTYLIVATRGGNTLGSFILSLSRRG